MDKRTVRIGFYASLVACAAAIAYSVAQILQVVGILRFPVDAILLYSFSLCIATPYLLTVLALHYLVPEDLRIWSHAALLFAVIYTVYVTLNYVVQLATVLPMTLAGNLGGFRVLDQTPHSLFWDVDALGYIFLGFSTLAASFVFERNKADRWLKYILLANGLVNPVIAFVYFSPHFSYTLLLLIALPWVVTAPGSLLLLALFFRRLRSSEAETAAFKQRV
jgi:hypothetical protein